MSGIQFVTDGKGRKVGVLIDLKKHGAIWEDFWDGLVSESRRKEKALNSAQHQEQWLYHHIPGVGDRVIIEFRDGKWTNAFSADSR
jgi:hypothetical protein